jgi:hypothetical protein
MLRLHDKRVTPVMRLLSKWDLQLTGASTISCMMKGECPGIKILSRIPPHFYSVNDLSSSGFYQLDQSLSVRILHHLGISLLRVMISSITYHFDGLVNDNFFLLYDEIEKSHPLEVSGLYCHIRFDS